LLCFGVLGVYYVLIVLLFYFCSFLADRDAETNWTSYPVTVPALMNVVLLQVFDPIYSTLADQLTQQENHVSFSEFEGNYISKLFMFKFLSICGPILMINYINSLAGLTCVQDDCYKHARLHFATVFLTLFAYNIWEILEPRIKALFSKKKSFDPLKENQEIRVNENSKDYL
jgi:hypothetical protein